MADTRETLLAELRDAINAGDYTEATNVFNDLSEEYGETRKEESKLVNRVKALQNNQQLTAEERVKFNSFLQARAAAEFQRTGLLTGGVGLSLGAESADSDLSSLASTADTLIDQEKTLQSETTTAKSKVKEKTVPAKVVIDISTTIDEFTGDTSELTVEITNVGEQLAEEVRLDITTNDSIQPNQTEDNIGSLTSGLTITRTYSFNTAQTSNGSGRIELGLDSANGSSDRKTITAPIESTEETKKEEGLSRFDQNNTGQIGFNDVIEAIKAHNDGRTIGGKKVSFNDVISVIKAHNKNKTV